MNWALKTVVNGGALSGVGSGDDYFNVSQEVSSCAPTFLIQTRLYMFSCVQKNVIITQRSCSALFCQFVLYNNVVFNIIHFPRYV